MNPSLQHVLANSMQPGNSPLNSVTVNSPNFDPQLDPYNPAPMPNKSPMSQIHISHPALHAALQNRGINPETVNYTPPQYATPNAAADGTDSRTITIPGKISDQSGKAGTQIPLSKAELIVRALDRHLKHTEKMESGQYSQLSGSEPMSSYINSTPLTKGRMESLTDTNKYPQAGMSPEAETRAFYLQHGEEPTPLSIQGGMQPSQQSYIGK